MPVFRLLVPDSQSRQAKLWEAPMVPLSSERRSPVGLPSPRPSPSGRGGVNLACLPLTALFSGLEGRFGGRRVASWGARLTLFSGLEGG